MRTSIRYLLSCGLIGMLSLGAAWAGAALTPVVPDELGHTPDVSKKPRIEDGGAARKSSASRPPQATGLMAGAAKVSMMPSPDAADGEVWETENCRTLGEDAASDADHVADFRVRWLENSNCIYMGGYGIGPMNPITSWDDPYGLWVRSIALSDGDDELVLTLIDAVYWEARYNSMCGDYEGGCGWHDLQEQLGAELNLPEDSFMFASTHSHTAPDFIGGWGGVPEWYMHQITDSIKASVRASLSNLKPARLEIGESIVRERNGERRDFYRSAEDDTFSWFRVTDAAQRPRRSNCAAGGAEPTPACPATKPGDVIATVGAYPAHPVTADPDPGIADADFPAVFARSLEGRFGGVGAFFQTGLGNLSPRGDKVAMGEGLATLVPALGRDEVVEEADLRVEQRRWDQPVTNIPLGSLGVTGFFGRTFNRFPTEVHAGKSSQRPCTSASPVSVDTGVTAAKLGPLWITGGPGELFSNITNTIEERNPRGVTLALGLVNDGLGYIIQSFETDHVGRQGAGFVGSPAAEYEDAYSTDHCFGDKTLETTLQLLEEL
ncbi:MAG: hypothetical protein ACRDK3_00265 [Actinomycetota bacterium]